MASRRPSSSIVQTARWIAAKGPGGVFTYPELRAHVQHSQADRRKRELATKFRWIFWTNKQDTSLASGEHRLVMIGDPIHLGEGVTGPDTSRSN